MPLYTVIVASGVYDPVLKTITVSGGPFAENQYAPTGKIEISKDGGPYIEIDGYSSWGDGVIVGTFLVALLAGTYSVRATSGDNLTGIKSDAFVVGGGSTGKGYFFFFEQTRSC